jgi:preprotein translocase subunit YajC
MNSLVSFIPLILVWLVLYLVFILPSRRKKRKREQMIKDLRINDHVVTSGGVSGRFVGRKDKLITLEVAPNVRFDVDPAKIESASAGNQPPTQRECTRCSSPLDPADRFCRQCSQPVSAAEMPPPPPAAELCPQCGTPLPPDASFCGECGAPVE